MRTDELHSKYEEDYRRFYESHKNNEFLGKNILEVIELGDFKVHKEKLLVVGFNPSGDDEQYCFERNSIWYDKEDDHSGYIREIRKFARDCGFDEEFTRLDTFCVKQLKQKVIERDIKKNENFYKEMLQIFVDTVVQIRPVVIVFANAYVSRIVREQKLCDRIKVESQDMAYGGFKLTFTDSKNDQVESYAYFSTMLSNGCLDKGSKQLLVWAVNNYMFHKHGRPWPDVAQNDL